MVAFLCTFDCQPVDFRYFTTMNKLPGVLLFLVLVIIILEILTLRALSSAEKRIYALEKKVETLTIAPVTAPAAAQPAGAK